MIKYIIRFSLRNKLLIIIAVLALIAGGLAALRNLPLDAVPDITNNQVQVVSVSPTLAPQEMEQLITYPIEAAMTNLPDVVEVRSISRYGLSVVTVVFKDRVGVMKARQYVQEQLNIAAGEIPEGLASPELMPITTGLGEIYQYVLTVDPAFAHKYDAIELRTIQDWIVKRQLNGIPGIIEVSSFGGYLKQFEVAANPILLKAQGVTLHEVVHALELNNENSGSSYIEKGPYSFYIRTEGRLASPEDIASVVIKVHDGVPVRVRDIGLVRIGSAKRYGAMTMDGKGEVVGGITLMLKGANSSEALRNVKKRVETIRPTLPPGVDIYPYLDRSKLISKTTHTVTNNLLEGGAIVVLILLLLLGNLRAGIIVASIIPLSMLFAFIMMRIFGISANLMSLGAIDFGIVVDGAVIIVESLLHVLALGYVGKTLTQQQMDNVVLESTSRIYRSAAFGILIILVVFVPILTLQGIEGKTFRPMAQTVGFAIFGSLLLSLTYVPVVASLFVRKHISSDISWADRLMNGLKRLYKPVLSASMRYAALTLSVAIVLIVLAAVIFSRMGAEFVPTLEEGDLAMQQTIKPGSSLEESIRSTTRAEKILLDNFPEVDHVVSKIGTAEVPTDPMAIEDADIMIILKDKQDWVSSSTREGLIAKMKAALAPVTWASYEFTQPIQLRFNELMTGAKSDVSVKIFGESTSELKTQADRAASIIATVEGAADIRVDQTDGLQQIRIRYDRNSLARHGLNVAEINELIRAAYAGVKTGMIYEEERKFDLVVRLAPQYRQDVSLKDLNVTTPAGKEIPISSLVHIDQEEGPMLISREQARRFINIGVNVRNRDVQSMVEEIQAKLESELDLPPAYEIQYGGQFENLRAARQRLLIALPVALALILLLLYMAFNSVSDALIIFAAVPLSAIGGVLALYLRGMPFSISSGIGFIALFGVAVLNGIVLVSAIKQFDMKDYATYAQLIKAACLTRLRPVLMTALVAAFGFVPMALSTSNGAEVQRPLATVVIGGLITSTLLTLLVLPTIYHLVKRTRHKPMNGALAVLAVALPVFSASAQQPVTFDSVFSYARLNNPAIANYDLEIEKVRRELKAIGQWAPTELNYVGGNINTADFDNYFEVRQDFSHFFTKKKKRQFVEDKVEVTEAQQEVYYNDLRRLLHQLYVERQYWEAKAILSQEIMNAYDIFLPKMLTQYNAGEIDAITYSLAESEILSIRNDNRMNLINLEMNDNALRAMMNAPDSVEWIYPALSQMAIDTQRITAAINLYIQLFNKQQSLTLAEAEYERSMSRSPGANIGYMHQSIENDFGFQGIVAGIQIPIDRREARMRMEQLDIERQKLNNSKEEFYRTSAAEISILRRKLIELGTSLNDYSDDFLTRNVQNKERLDIQLETGEIDFIRYQYIRHNYLRIENQYLDLLKSYNDTVIQLLHFTPQYIRP